MTMFRITASIMVAAYAASTTNAFLTTPNNNSNLPPLPSSSRSSNTQLYNEGSSGGGMEEIEFRIYPDGRVTEVVRGVKGENCEKITEAINNQLGNVVASQPTEEMFEQEVVIDQTIMEKDGGGGGWEGSSSW
eukprot:CAMPEP_0201686520 /NCGR_PEP_ID=MMETSP0578-20130828/940_1 /ASSEMBLY_ACC=CAM_ASM_000663 /TAXON_ID=267565 /ORGANISM="Skeletonema grethea, Strain CCMP 1804" /LENGTH=132 /DNA_ID=CAMNT_0048170587 /DNA_START=122 /DNA_END=517 /DNA_ORIENTATION=+